MEKHLNYAKYLLENSFKEASLFWVRNSAFTLFQTLLIGFYLNSQFKSTDNTETLFIAVTIVGIFLSLSHIITLKLSRKFNHGWGTSFKNWVSQSVPDPEEEERLTHLRLEYKKIYNFKNRFNSTTFYAIILSYIFGAFWVFALYREAFMS
ncbi:MAG: hypothetical protein JEZ03_16930 [Bacteroidales bacterium]|nr:hypothetical protein [Bacteroidales bacterium]